MQRSRRRRRRRTTTRPDTTAAVTPRTIVESRTIASRASCSAPCRGAGSAADDGAGNGNADGESTGPVSARSDTADDTVGADAEKCRRGGGHSRRAGVHRWVHRCGATGQQENHRRADSGPANPGGPHRHVPAACCGLRGHRGQHAGRPPAWIPTRPARPPCATRAAAPGKCRTVRESAIRADVTAATAFATPGVATTASLAVVVGNGLGRNGRSGDRSTKQRELWRRSTPGTSAFMTRPPRYGASDRPSSGSRTSRRSPTAPATHRCAAARQRQRSLIRVITPPVRRPCPGRAANPHTRRTAARRHPRLPTRQPRQRQMPNPLITGGTASNNPGTM